MDTLAYTAGQSERLGPGPRVATSFDFGKRLAKPDGGVCGFCDGELLA